MGCGCGRKRPNRTDRINKQRSQILKSQRLSLKSSKVKPLFVLASKSSICMFCIETKQSPSERKKGIKVCHKSNRLINNILRDPRFVCPIGKWKNVK